MKGILSSWALCFSIMSLAQEQPGTIYCNQNQNVVLIMPSSINRAVTGSENFVFSYNESAPDSLGLLQGKPGLESNLLIRTSDGGIYSYILKYKDTLSRFNYFIPIKDRINRADSLKSKMVRDRKSKVINSPDNYYFDKHSEYYLNTSKDRLAKKKNRDLKLEVRSVNHYRDHVFVVYGVENKSEIDFEINNLQLYKVQGKQNRRSSFQKLLIKPVSSYRLPKKIRQSEKIHFVMVFPKFTLGINEKLSIYLDEARGSRYLGLDLNSFN